MADTLTAYAAAQPAVAPGAIELDGPSPAIARVRELVTRVAVLDSAVLIAGERGIDLEAVARELHQSGRQPSSPWLVVDCTAPAASIDGDLFGHSTPEAATDLVAVTSGSRIAAARGGTLFLRDAAELPAAMQARLARLARDGEIRLDGSPVAANLRLVAGTLPAIDREVREHRFRPDLYRRLAASRIDLPPLRERPEDIPTLVARLVEEAGGRSRRFTHAALAVMSALPWPGNLAELRAVVSRVLAAGADATIQIEQVLPTLHLDRSLPAFLPAGSLREARLRFERDYIASVLQYHGWKVADAAQTLGIQRPNLYRKARQLGIPVTRITE